MRTIFHWLSRPFKPFAFGLVMALLPLVSLAQTSTGTLTGTLSVSTGEVFPYKLYYTETAGRITGYSITYREPDDTKATITGTLDRQARTLAFKESEIIYSHSFHTRAFMCLIDAGLNYVQGGTGKVLTGPITSREADKTACTPGTITFSSDEEIQNLFSYHDKFDTVITFKKRSKETAPPPAAVPEPEVRAVAMEKITTGVVKTYIWKSAQIVLDVWSGSSKDGDKITLAFDGRVLLDHYTLTKEKKRISIPIPDKAAHSLSITANNDAADGPNTANLLLTDGATSYRVISYNTTGNSSLLRFRLGDQ
jgi:hypothetical protein